MICTNCNQEGGEGLLCEKCGAPLKCNDNEPLREGEVRLNIVKRIIGLSGIVMLTISMFIPFLKVNLSNSALGMLEAFGVSEQAGSYRVVDIFKMEDWPIQILIGSLTVLALAGLMAWKMIRGTTIVSMIGAFPIWTMYIAYFSMDWRGMYRCSIGFALPILAYILLLIAAILPKKLYY